MNSLNRSLSLIAYPDSFILTIVKKNYKQGTNLVDEIQILNDLLIIHLPLNVISNILIIATVWLIRYLDTPDNYIIGAIAVADLLTGLFAIPSVMLFYAKQNWLQRFIKGSPYTCVLGWIAKSFGPTTALTLLTFMAFQRYLAINHPFWYTKTISVERVMRTMSLLFLVQIIFHVSIFSICPPYSSNETNLYFQCTALYLTEWYGHILMTATMIQLVLGCFFTIQVAYIARNQFRKQHSVKTLLNGYDQSQSTYQFKQVMVTIKLMFLYILLWIPVAAGIVVYALSEDLQLIKLLNIIGYHSVFISSWSNALVYATTKSTYRKAFQFLLTRSPRKWNTFSSWLRSHTYHADGRPYDMTTTKSGSVSSDQPSYYQMITKTIPKKSMIAKQDPTKTSFDTWLDASVSSKSSKTSKPNKTNIYNKCNKVKSNRSSTVQTVSSKSDVT